MANTKMDIAGVLRLDADGLTHSLTVGKKQNRQTIWVDVYPDVFEREWPDLVKMPEKPKSKSTSGLGRVEEMRIIGENQAAEKEWSSACEAYAKAFRATPEYRGLASEFLEIQRREPRFLFNLGSIEFWVYRDKLLSVESTEPEPLRDKATVAMLIKHHVLRRERNYEKVRREVEALENLEKLEKVPREPIPESVRLFVWQRDKGQCVKCGARERLEFDHIIPVVSGGSNTERNVQLLCEACNRVKGATI